MDRRRPTHDRDAFPDIYRALGNQWEKRETPMLPTDFGRWYRQAAISDREIAIDILYESFKGTAEEKFRDKLDAFEYNVSANYAPAKARMVHKALRMAVVAHQYNNRAEKRFRKADKSPFVSHPLEMALRLVGEEFDTPFAFTIVSATLLHDVAEDVDLGIGLQNHDWLEIIREEFNYHGETTAGLGRVGFLKNQQLGDLIAQLVEGASEMTQPITADEIKYLRASPFYQMLRDFLEKGGSRSERRRIPLDKDSEQALDKVIYDLHQLFKKTLQSPDHWSIFLIKLADVNHNLQSPEWVKTEKVLRGRLAAGIAEWMGWHEMRDMLISKMAYITNVNNPYAPLIHHRKLPDEDTRETRVEVANYSQAVIEMLRKIPNPSTLEIDDDDWEVAWYFPTSDQPYEHEGPGGTSISLPELIIKLPRQLIDQIAEDRYQASYHQGEIVSLKLELPSFGRTKSGEQYCTLEHFYSSVEIVTQAVLERQRLDFIALVGKNRAKSFILRLESKEPHLIDLFYEDSQVKPGQVPETALFNDYLRTFDTPQNRQAWDYHISNLIAFLYEPDLPYNLGKGVVMLVLPDQVIFMNGNQPISKVLQTLGISPLSEKATFTNLFGQSQSLNVNWELAAAVRSSSKYTWGRVTFLQEE